MNRIAGRLLWLLFALAPSFGWAQSLGTPNPVQAYVRFVIPAVNFNATNTDNPLTIQLPAGISRWQINAIKISNASASISTATVGLFTGAGGTGQTIAATQAVTVTATAADTLNNMQVLAATNAGTMAYNDTTIFFRLVLPQGSAATADVVIVIAPMS